MIKKFITVAAFLVSFYSMAENLWQVPPFELKANAKRSLPKITIEPRQRYHLEFKAKSSGLNVVENSPVLDELLRIRYPKMIPLKMSKAFLFIYDNGNKNIIPQYMERRVYIYSNEWQTYQWEFYAPNTAAQLNLYFESSEGLEIKEVVLKKISDAKLLNVNSELKMGKYHFPGYGNLHKTIIYENSGLDISGGWTVCDPIALNAGERIKLTVTGEALPGKSLLIRTNFYRDPVTEKNFIRRNKNAMRINGKKRTVEFTVLSPEKTEWLRLSFGGGIIYEVKVEKINE